jgi:hypothetical protein
VIDEGAYVLGTPNDKKHLAVAAAGVNIAGDMASTYAGMKVGAAIGVWAAPWTLGLSIPVGAALGGLGGHVFYNYVIDAPKQVRETITGIKKP